MFGPASGAFVGAASIHVSSSAITVKGLIDFRRLRDAATDLILAILVVRGHRPRGGARRRRRWRRWCRHDRWRGADGGRGFVGPSLAASRSSRTRSTGSWRGSPREVMLLTGWPSSSGWRRSPRTSSLSEAIGRAHGGRHPLRDPMRAPKSRIGSWSSGMCSPRCSSSRSASRSTCPCWGRSGGCCSGPWRSAIVGKLGERAHAADRSGFTRRQGLNVGGALVAHGEFTIIIAGLAAANTDRRWASGGTTSRPLPGCTCCSLRSSASC